MCQHESDTALGKLKMTVHWVLRFLTRVTHIFCRSISELKGLPGKTGRETFPNVFWSLTFQHGAFSWQSLQNRHAVLHACLWQLKNEAVGIWMSFPREQYHILRDTSDLERLIPLLLPVITASNCLTSPTCLFTDTIRKGNVLHFIHRIMWTVS